MNDLLKFRAMCFEAYGLNKYRNFLNKNTLKFDNDEDLYNFMCSVIAEHECPESAVFAIDFYGGMWAGIAKVDDGIIDDEEIHLIGRKDLNPEWFAQLDAEYRFCCYSLLIETKPGIWKIIDEELQEGWDE